MDTHADISGEGWSGPAIGLLDLDAFFASVEQLDHPEWRGLPVIVGGDANRRGVVSTASYEARVFGVHSAMSSAQARRLCPQAIWTQGRYDRYREVSAQVMAVIERETPYVEQVSIDEAFFDITPGRFSHEDPVAIVERISEGVAQLGVTCSIGLGPNKTCAKIASERNKPNGTCVVWPGMQQAFLAPLPVRSMSGIGPSTERALHELGIHTLGDLAVADCSTLEARLGVAGRRMIERAAGREVSSVARRSDPKDVKSVSNERTFAQDLTDAEEVEAAVGYVSSVVARRLRKKGLCGRTVTLKLAFGYGQTHTAQKALRSSTDDEHAIARAARELLAQIWSPGTPIRLLGIGLSGFDERDDEQPDLFEDVEAQLRERERAQSLSRASDSLRERFGDAAVMYGSELKFLNRVSNTAPLNKDAD